MGIFKRTLLCVLSVVLVLGATLFTACTPEPDPVDEFLGMYDMEGLTPTFRDEFNGDRLDLSKWQHEVRGNWYNNEVQYYDEDGVTVTDGTLKITAHKTPKAFDRNGQEKPMSELVPDASASQNPLFQYTNGDRVREYGSSRLRTYQKFAQTYGRFEARIKMPANQGLWPAFWMLPETGGWPQYGEIDIMEAKGRIPDIIGNAIHFGTPHTYNSQDYRFPEEGTIETFHNYGVEWDEERIAWFVDGVKIFEQTNDKWFTSIVPATENPQAPFDKPFHMLLNLAVGGDFDGGRIPPDDFTEASMEVDWVRVWQFDKYIAVPV